jgi:two-component system, OmpR family, phosphate regulon response regulator PhoB
MACVLVVEDEAAIAELLVMNLRHVGHDVMMARDAAQADEKAASKLPDLVILDWMLPGESGVSLLRRWRAGARVRDVPVMMLTGLVEQRDMRMALDAGADDYMHKPFHLSELLARVQALLRGTTATPS